MTVAPRMKAVVTQPGGLAAASRSDRSAAPGPPRGGAGAPRLSSLAFCPRAASGPPVENARLKADRDIGTAPWGYRARGTSSWQQKLTSPSPDLRCPSFAPCLTKTGRDWERSPWGLAQAAEPGKWRRGQWEPSDKVPYAVWDASPPSLALSFTLSRNRESQKVSIVRLREKNRRAARSDVCEELPCVLVRHGPASPRPL